MDEDPGKSYEYSNLSSFLLGAILQRVTKNGLLEFAKTNLFDPLGITDYRWEKNPQGIPKGHEGLWLKPHDMAKIGLLYLNQGRWGNQQIVGAPYIKDATTPYSSPNDWKNIRNKDGGIRFLKSI
ncbi:MAG: serine hydrolase [Pseudobacteriovorax sp.]|nr:serine hydrolase [Pseudobacteriovorax sp.]